MTRSIAIDFTDHQDNNILLDVQYEYTKARKATLTEPAEYPELEILSIFEVVENNEPKGRNVISAVTLEWEEVNLDAISQVIEDYNASLGEGD